MAILKLRRGTSIPSLAESELFYHTSLDTLVVGDGTNSHILLKSGSNNVNLVDISGTISASYIHVANDITIKGNIVLGDEIANDSISINAELNGSLIPDTDNAHDLGSLSKKYRNIYVNSLPGSNIVSSSQQISNYNTFLEIDGMGVFSGSSQVNANTITNFDSNVKDKINDDGVISGSSQLTTEFDTRYLNTNGDSVISSSAQLTTEFDTRYLNTDGDSVISSSAQLTTEFDTRYLNTNGDGVISSSAQLDSVFLEINGDGVFSGSSQVNADSIINFDSNVKDKMNSDGVISGSTQLEGDFLQINGDSVVSSSAQISHSSSVDSRLDSLETDSHTHANKANLDTINQDLATTDNVTFDTGSFTGNVTVTGNLTVLGSATEIQTSELRIEDKLITVASGSVDSTAADGAGLEIDGANKSLTWDHSSTSFVFDAKVSSSVGFKGEGGELTGIDTGQVTEVGNLYYTNTRVLDYINDQGVISGSSQVNADSITNFDSNVKDKLNDEGVISGSSQITITESQISDLDHYTDTDVKAKLNVEGVLSGSGQLITDFDSRYLNTNGDSVVSGSSQIDVTQTTNYGSINQYSDTKVKTKLTAENVLSSSQQVIDSLPNGLVSGSEQITDGSGIISSSAFSSPSQGTVRATINGTQTDVDTGLQSADSPTFAGLTLTGTSAALSTEYTALFLTGSDNSITTRELGDASFYSVSSSIEDGNPNVLGNAGAVKNYVDGKIIEAGSGDITQVTPTPGGGLSGGGFVGAVSLSLDTGSTHFTDGVVENLPSGLVSQSSQLYTDLDSRYIQDLGEGAFSSSAQVDHDATTNFVANEHIDHSTISVGSGKGLTGGGTIVTSRSLTLATGSDHFRDGVKEKINLEGVFSSSAQVNADTITNFDSNVLSYINDLGVQSGSDTVDYTDADTLEYINDLGVHSGSFLGTATTSNLSEGSNLYYTDARVSTRTDTILNHSNHTNISVSKVGNELRFSAASSYGDSDVTDHINDLGVISGSSQVDATSVTNFDSNVKDKLNDELVVSSSAQISNYNTFLEKEAPTHSNESNLDSIDQDLANNDNVQFADLVLTGDLTVQGTTTTLNTQELTIEDKLLSVASGSTTTAAADGGGFHISGANASITWDNGNSRLEINKSTHFTGNVQATGDVVAYASSDERLKNEIIPISNPLEKINSIGGYSFVWNEEKQNIYKGKDYGIIAQEIEEILPELVQTREDGYKSVKYDKLVSLLIEGIKELSKEVSELKNKIGE